MIAIILAAGIGQRLGDLTLLKPKCLTKVNGKPILNYTLHNLQEAGFAKVVIVIGYLGKNIVEDIGFVGVKGDANSDENVNILDVMNLIDIILHDTTLTTEIIWAMDLDSTESLNILDVTKLVHFILFH